MLIDEIKKKSYYLDKLVSDTVIVDLFDIEEVLRRCTCENCKYGEEKVYGKHSYYFCGIEEKFLTKINGCLNQFESKDNG